MRLAYVTSLALIGILAGICAQNADAQLGAGKAFTLEGNGYTASSGYIVPTSIDLEFIIMQKGATTEFTLQNGMIDINGKGLTVSGFSGTLLKNGQYFRITSKALDSDGKEFSLKVLGTLIEKTASDSIYSLTGTLSDSSGKSSKLVYTSKITEFTATVKQIDTNKKKDVTVKILKGSANPEQQTYVEQIGGFSFKFFSEDRISVGVGGTITFVNEDVVSHSLKSGILHNAARHNSFTADGKISSGDIQPGKSWSVTFQEPGFYRIFDEKYQWMDATVFVSKDTSSKTLGSGKPHN